MSLKILLEPFWHFTYAFYLLWNCLSHTAMTMVKKKKKRNLRTLPSMSQKVYVKICEPVYSVRGQIAEILKLAQYCLHQISLESEVLLKLKDIDTPFSNIS